MNALNQYHGKRGQGQILPVATKKGIFRIDLSQVLYFEKDLRKINVYGEKETWTFYGRLMELEAILDESFCRCHNSIVVNLAQVNGLERFQFSMKNGKDLAVSQSRYSKVKKQYWDFLSREKEGKERREG